MNPIVSFFRTSLIGGALIFSLASAFLSPPVAAKNAVNTLPIIAIKVGTQVVQAEVAATEETREKGLMFREKLAKNEGMLFVFSEIGYHAMWMRNTPLPLAVAFMDEGGKIVSIHEMQPHTEITHQAAGPARFALEMNGGWFKSNKVSVGDTIKGLEKAPKPR
jgi:hypothetical protein